ncbi:hypothetical protein CBR_g51492 [Chara braunii]|uniref:Uncharacterized protein n=1 Tax=Chara braunii TaxID=69332 RepID=A0A388K6F3_CHABU|nr:hypothetical protein CBR_g51492 [Chara braunii]|eukprot:GBG65609.1 hypothetical protein CBR_g51492 [Chara braunii]
MPHREYHEILILAWPGGAGDHGRGCSLVPHQFPQKREWGEGSGCVCEGKGGRPCARADDFGIPMCIALGVRGRTSRPARRWRAGECLCLRYDEHMIRDTPATVINFLLAMVGVGLIGYGAWMLNAWWAYIPTPPQPPVPPTTGFSSSSMMGKTSAIVSAGLNDLKLPAPWFIYVFLIAGIFMAVVTCTGLIGAGTNNGCCLSCHSLGLAVLLMAQAALAAVVFLNDNWQDYLPADPTGQLVKTKSFIAQHLQIFQGIAIAVASVEVLGLLLSMSLKAMQGGRRRRGRGSDSDDEYGVISRTTAIRQPLLPRVQPGSMMPPPPPPLTGAPAAAGQGPPRSDAWSQRMRERYGLDVSDFSYNPEGSRYGQQQPQQSRVSSQDTENSGGGCTIM